MTDMTLSAPMTAPKIVYALFVLAILIPGIPAVVGVIYAYIARGKDAAADTHLTFLIRTFWISLAMFVVCLIATATLVGMVIAVPLALIASAWTLVRLISGAILVLKDQPIRSIGEIGFVAR